MSTEHALLLCGLCLLAGYAFGCFPGADVAAHCVAGTGIRCIGNGTAELGNIRRCLGKGAALGVAAGDVLKTLLACWFCYKLAAPDLEQAAMWYGGLGVLLGHSWPIGGKTGARGALVVCAWVAVALPVSGILCTLAGAVSVAGIGYAALGAVTVPLLAIPVAWLQYGVGSAAAMLAAALLIVWQYRGELAGIRRGQTEKTMRRWPFIR